MKQRKGTQSYKWGKWIVKHINVTFAAPTIDHYQPKMGPCDMSPKNNLQDFIFWNLELISAI